MFEIIDRASNAVNTAKSVVNKVNSLADIPSDLANDANKYLSDLGLTEDKVVNNDTDKKDKNNEKRTLQSGSATFRNPDGGDYLNFKNLTWINLTGRKLKAQTSNVKGGQIVIDQKEPEYSFDFIAPPELMETVQHDWSEYESWVNRLGGLMQTGAKAIAEIKGISQASIGLYNKLADQIKTGEIKDITKNIKDIPLVSGVVQTRVDSTLVYAGSQRREWNFTVNLAAYKNPIKEIIRPVYYLMKLSCPKKTENSIYIEAPYVFKLRTYDSTYRSNNLIFSNWCALKSVQPTWSGPYVNGYPIRCDLTLTLTEIEPLYQSTIGEDSKVNVQNFPETKSNKNYNSNQPDKKTDDTWKILKSQVGSVSGALDTAGNVIGSVGNSINSVKSTVDRYKRTIDEVKKLPNIL
jgi:hypothetical protein